MKKLITAVACAAALCVGGAARAGVLTFDDPGVIDIDNVTNVATYTENGFTISGQAATFLTLASTLVGGIDGTSSLSLKALGDGAFSLLSLDYAFFDLGFGAPPGTLTLIGLLGGAQVASEVLSLGAVAHFGFGADFQNVTEVTFTGSSGFALDNISAVPEPGTMALTTIALMGMVLRVRRRRIAA